MVASALAAWIVVGVALCTAGVLGTVAGVWWAVTTLRRTVHRLLGPSEALSARESAELPEGVPRLPPPRDRRSTPHWAIPSDGEKPSEAA